MKNTLSFITLIGFCSVIFPSISDASPGREGFESLKQCVMQNDLQLCHKATTPSSHDLVDRFMSYKLTPCLPTNFTYSSEESVDGWLVVKATMPAPNNRTHTLRLAFTKDSPPLLDVPASLQMGLGDKWQNKVQMAENLFLLIRANAGGEFQCNQLDNLIKK